MHDLETALSLAVAFVDEPFSEDPRHIRRIDMLTAYENRA
jgi:ribose 5-phosphate isomerase B